MFTENHYRGHTSCCEIKQGGYACCCESTSHNKKSLLHFIERSTHDEKRIELIFRSEDDADEFYFNLTQNNYKRIKNNFGE